jgi:hypothetical protein
VGLMSSISGNKELRFEVYGIPKVQESGFRVYGFRFLV